MNHNSHNYTANYGIEKFFDSILLRHRQKVFKKIFGLHELHNIESILDIGSTADDGAASNIFLDFFREKKVISISDQEIPDQVKAKFPHVKFEKGDALKLIFPSQSFDLVFSNATLEHVGNSRNQKLFIKEAARVSRKKTVIVFPNRWFPIETHTKLPLIHFLPNRIHRWILRTVGFHDLSLEKNLNIPTHFQIKRYLKELDLNSYSIHKIKTLCFTSNLVILVTR
jgi:hypothetical protein